MKVEIKNLTKTYGTKLALNNFSLTLEENKIYGLLGRNGAGKTTLMQILAGQQLQTEGEILVNGEKPFENHRVLQHISLINESNNFKSNLKVKDVLKIGSLFYPNWCMETANRLLEAFNLNGGMKTKSLSKGMESSLGIIMGLASKTKITILDEPYIGLDASARYRFYDILLEEYQREPRTIILSTHLIDEVSNLFEEVIIINNGELLLKKEKDELIDLSLQISGNKTEVDQYVAEKNVIYEKEIMGLKTVLLFGDNYDIEDVKARGFKIEPTNIQKLMVYLTEQKGGSVNV